MTANQNTFEFKAEVKKLLDILVHSLYTSKEIFLRELVSNSSDALDKLRFQSISGTEITDKDLPYEIHIDFDEKAATITVSDHGIGMTRDEIILNIGTIAKSGTEEFLRQLAESKSEANNIIGKFGIGFYSVFMVAKQVTIKSKSYKPDEPAIIWKSDGLASYEISEMEEPMQRGTIIEIHLKDDAKEFAEKFRIQSILKKHSSFISFPIFLQKETINTITALWREPKSSIKQEQYNEFYKFLSYDMDDPMFTLHKSVDAPIQFNSLLFIPKKNVEMFWMNRDEYGLDLYVRRVLIQHKNKDLIPEYMSFVRGVVDSEDIPLNISRETLQENSVFMKISSSVTGQILNFLLETAKNEPEKYAEFWKEHGKIFKLGYTDFTNLEKFKDLLRFNSSASESGNDLTSFEEYTSRMKEGQKEIFYLSGNNRSAIELDPHLELFKKKGVEVLYFFDPVDEFIIPSLRKYKDFEFKSADTKDLKSLDKLEDVIEDDDTTEKLSKDDEKQFSSLLSKIKAILGEKVTEVVESKRLKDSPSCLISADDGFSSSMQKILRMTHQEVGATAKIFEINKNHPLTRNLLKVFTADANDDFIPQTVMHLYEISLLLEGNLTDPHELITRTNKILEKSSGWYVATKNL